VARHLDYIPDRPHDHVRLVEMNPMPAGAGDDVAPA
jgi:hypothetical protein